MAPKMTQKQTLEQAAENKRLAAPKGASPELFESNAEASN